MKTLNNQALLVSDFTYTWKKVLNRMLVDKNVIDIVINQRYVSGTRFVECSIFLYFTGKIFSGWHSSPPLTHGKMHKYLLIFMV